jgi:hypothetical protein
VQVLDVKTGIHQADSRFLAGAVSAWKALGVTVVGVGSFNYDQNQEISGTPSSSHSAPHCAAPHTHSF